MMCPPSDRAGRSYYGGYGGYGANTLWFQYLLCQQESIPSLACWLFTSNWNQADFGQYYLYDELLDEEDGIGPVLGLDGDILPLLVLSGGLGGGAYGGVPTYGGGHAVYRREVAGDTCPTGQVQTSDGQCVTPARKRRETTSPCPNGERNAAGLCPGARKRREECSYAERDPFTGQCPGAWCHLSERDPATGLCPGARKRREECPDALRDPATGLCPGARKRRGECPNGGDRDPATGLCPGARKRREECPDALRDPATGLC